MICDTENVQQNGRGGGTLSVTSFSSLVTYAPYPLLSPFHDTREENQSGKRHFVINKSDPASVVDSHQ